MKVLVTAFDPFGGEQINPAQEVLSLLPEQMKGVDLIKLIVPTAFHHSFLVVKAALKQHQPDAVLLLGQAGGREGISLERVAININDAEIPDNVGLMPEDEPIAPGGPAAYFATLPIKAMVDAILEAGLPAQVSNTAGTFVCNHLMYSVLHEINQHSLPIKAGFIHLPFLPEQAKRFEPVKPSMALSAQARGLLAAIEALVRENKAH